ncbi:DUF1992 domain-containing protein [Geodermatophilus sp. SYSU D00742]
MTERKPTGMSFETWVESQISRGLAQGAFEGLAGAGKPLPRRDRDETAYDWAVEKARREGVDTGAMLPPGLALRKERDDLPSRVAGMESEDAVRAVAEDYNARVQAFWRRPQESRWAPVPGLADVDALVEQWRATRPPPAPPVPPAPPPPAGRRRRWWRRRER